MGGPIILAVGLGVFVSRGYYIRIYRELEKETLTVLLFGMVAMSTGIAQIIFHNIWDTLPQIVVSLLDIRVQFLAEAVALTLFGGAIGIALGWGISFVINLTGVLQTSVSTSSVFLAFGVSAGIGIVFGYYPASRAAQLNPIDALRYE